MGWLIWYIHVKHWPRAFYGGRIHIFILLYRFATFFILTSMNFDLFREYNSNMTHEKVRYQSQYGAGKPYKRRTSQVSQVRRTSSDIIVSREDGCECLCWSWPICHTNLCAVFSSSLFLLKMFCICVVCCILYNMSLRNGKAKEKTELWDVYTYICLLSWFNACLRTKTQTQIHPNAHIAYIKRVYANMPLGMSETKMR